MAENKKALLRRRKAVQSTMKITKAMKLVSAAKLRRAQEKVTAARPYARTLAKTLQRLAGTEAAMNNPLLRPRDFVRSVAYVLVSADRGLAGSYNAGIIRKAHNPLRPELRGAQLITIGRKGRDYFKRRGVMPTLEFVGLGEEPSFARVREIVQQVIGLYLSGQVDEVRLVYTEFVNPVTQRPVETVLLPVPQVEAAEKKPTEGVTEYIYVPSAAEVLSTLVPKFVETVFYQAVLEAKASEQGARMTAMGNATDNAKELIDRLALAFNRARQAGITREISEIVGGAEALK